MESTGSTLDALRRRVRGIEPLRKALTPTWYRYRFGELGRLMNESDRIPNWSQWRERVSLYHLAAGLPPDPVILEIGCFLGASTVLMAGARHGLGSGIVHAVDPFDGSGDEFSAPVYAGIAHGGDQTLRGRFESAMRHAGVADRVVVHQATAEQLAKSWTEPVDLLYLDGDQSVEGARRAFDLFLPYLKVGGVIVLHNTEEREYAPDHDGNYRLRVGQLVPPRFAAVFTLDGTTFAHRVA